MTARPWPG